MQRLQSHLSGRQDGVEALRKGFLDIDGRYPELPTMRAFLYALPVLAEERLADDLVAEARAVQFDARVLFIHVFFKLVDGLQRYT
jgi:hypothetical protein